MKHPLRSIFSVAFVAANLAACTSAPEPAAPVTVAQAAAVTPKTAAAKPVKPASPKHDHAAAAPAVTAAKPKPVVIVGQREEDVISLLGHPQAEIPALPAKILRYSGAGCSLEIYMFPDMTMGGFRALDMTATGTGTETQCVERVRASLLVQ